MPPKDADGLATSADNDQTAPQEISSRASLIWVYTICLGQSVQKFRKIMGSDRLELLISLLMQGITQPFNERIQV